MLEIRPFIKKIASLIGLAAVYRSLYFYLHRPKNSIVDLRVDGVAGRWYAKNYYHFIYLTKTAFGAADETKALQAMMAEIRADDVVYDIGAFIGLHTILFAKKTTANGRVVAFEPHPDHYQALAQNIVLNGVHNVTLVNKALGQKAQQAMMKTEDMRLYVPQGKAGKEVMVVPGDQVVGELGLALPNVVKIDVEGYEYDVIYGLKNTLKNSACRFLVVEMHPTLLPAGIDVSMIKKLLESCGFMETATHGRGTTFHSFYHKRVNSIHI